MIRCDNGPELVAHALKDWCRFTGVTTGYIEPGAPWQNPYIESFNGHLRRELLDLESFNTLFEAQLLLDGSSTTTTDPTPSLNYQNPCRIRPPLKDGKATRTLITGGPKNGVRSNPYLALPFDLVPDFIPVAGQLDNAILVAITIAYVTRRAGREVIAELWPGSARGLQVVLGLAEIRV